MNNGYIKFFRLMIFLASLMTILLAGCTQYSSAAPGTVNIRDNYFDPNQITVAANTTIHWINMGSMGHSVTSTIGFELNSGIISPGSSYDHTFTTVGVYNYYCTIHGSAMSGMVTVTN